MTACLPPNANLFNFEDLIDESDNFEDSSIGQHPPLGDDEMQLMYQVTSALCRDTLILLALGPTSSGKTITLNRLTADLVQLDISKRKSHVDLIIRPDVTPDLFGGRQPACYVREFDFSSLPPNRLLGIAPLDTPLKLAVIDTPGFTNKIQLNEETIAKGMKSLDAFVNACKISLNSPKAHVVVIYFLKQTWTWSKVDSKIIKAIQAYYGYVGLFCITHSLVTPAFIQSPLEEELLNFKLLDLPDVQALREEEESYIELVSEADKEAALDQFEKSWVSLYKRLFSLSTHITKIKECVTDARIIFFENSPNLASNSDLGLSNLVSRFSRGLNYNYGSFFTILTSVDLIQSATQYMLLPTSMDRSRINRVAVYREEQVLSPFQKHDMEDVRKGQMFFFEECRSVVDDIRRDKIYRLSRSFFKSSLPTVQDARPLRPVESPCSAVPSSSQDSSRSCSSTLSDTDISSSASDNSEGAKKAKLKLSGIRALWSDLFESREEGFQFLTEETRNIPQSYQPNKKQTRTSARDNKSYMSESAQMNRRQSAPIFSYLGSLNPDLASLLSKKRSSESTQTYGMYYGSDSSANNIRLKKCASESAGNRKNSPGQRAPLSSSASSVPKRGQLLSTSSSGSMSPAEYKQYTRALGENEKNQHVLPSELEETIVSLIGDQRKQCMLCKDNIIYSICPKCKRGYCEACIQTFSRFQTLCKFDSSIMEIVSL